MITTKTLFGYSIKNGPNRAELIRAFDQAGDSVPEKPISFEIVKACSDNDGEEFYQAVQTRDIKITGLRYDGDSKYAFVVEGNINVCHLDKTHADPLKCKFIACYDAMTGKGNASLQIPD